MNLQLQAPDQNQMGINMNSCTRACSNISLCKQIQRFILKILFKYALNLRKHVQFDVIDVNMVSTGLFQTEIQKQKPLMFTEASCAILSQAAAHQINVFFVQGEYSKELLSDQHWYMLTFRLFLYLSLETARERKDNWKT